MPQFVVRPNGDAAVANWTFHTEATLPQAISKAAGTYQVARLSDWSSAATVTTPFTLAGLFSGGQAGFYGDGLDPAADGNLWQDVARGNPLTAYGQTVESYRALTSGADTYLQKTVSPAPSLAQDESGRPYLNFNGVTDCSLRRAVAIPDGTYDFMIALQRMNRSSAVGANAVNGSSAFGLARASDNNPAHTNAGTPSYYINGQSVQAGSTAVTRAQLIAAWPIDTPVVMEVRGLSLTAANWTGFMIGNYGSGFSINGIMRVWGNPVLRSTMTDDERNGLRAHLASLCGVTL